MADLGAPELLIILLAVVLVFGGSRVAELGGSLGKGIKEFKKAMKEDEGPAKTQADVTTTTVTGTAALPQPKRTLTCASCGSENAANAVFCNECGARLGGLPTMASQS